MRLALRDDQRKRISIILIVSVLLGVGLIFRLAQKQLFEHDKYLAMAQDQHQTVQELPAHRGKIYAKTRYGGQTVLATNQTYYALLVVPQQVEDKVSLAKKIANSTSLDEQDVFKAINNDKGYIPPLLEKIEYSTANGLAKKDLQGVYLVADDYRYYPEGSLTGQITGYINKEKEGQYGVEQYYNEILKGDLGVIRAQKDVYGRYISISKKEDPKDGQDLFLTLDLSLQNKAREVVKEAVKHYGASSGSIIIIHPQRGEILAMASSRGYDPNRYSEVAQDRGVEAFVNTEISAVYEPGSIMKAVTMASALDKEVIKPTTSKYFKASIDVGEETIWNSTREAFGQETMINVLENSDNVGMVWVQQKLGDKKFHRYLDRFGFGRLTGVDLEGEVVGRLLPLAEAQAVDLASNSFGQAISVTPLQMLTAFTPFTNKGKLVQPHILAKRINPETEEEIITKPKESEPILSLKTVDQTSDMLVSVVDHGHAKLAQVPGYQVAGKTGTAQVPTPDGYSETQTIHSFIGFAPAEDPVFLMLVKLDHPTAVRWSSESAAPVFAQMAQFALNYFQIPPSR